MPRTAAVRRSVSRAPRRAEIPLDDEPLTPEDMRAMEEGRKAFARGDYCTLDEAKAYVARLRRKASSALSCQRSALSYRILESHKFSASIPGWPRE